MRAAAFLLFVLFFVGCQPRADPEPEVEADLPTAVPEPGWTVDGSDLLLHDEDGRQLLRLGCSGGSPVELRARFGGFEPIGSEERVSLGLGEEIVTMVAQVVGADGPGLIAATRYSGSLGDDLEQAGAISASYGTQQFGPVGPPRAEQVGVLLAACGSG